MNLLKIFIACIFFYMFFSCNEKKDKQETAKALYTINIDSIKTVNNIKMSQIFKKARAILLEETDYAVIGQIDRLQVYDNYIFILDRHKAKKLFIFDKTGKYLRQIGSMGQNQREYLYISDFCLDANNREIYLFDDSKQIFLKYNFDTGKYLGTIDVGYDQGTSFYTTYLNGKIYTKLIYHNNLLKSIDLKTNTQTEFVNIDKYNCGWNKPYYTGYNVFYSKLYSTKYVEHFMNTVMSIDESGVHPYLSVSSENWVKKSDILPNEEILDNINRLSEKNRVFKIQNYMEYGDYIYFEYECGTEFFVVFNKKTEEVYQCDYWTGIENDLLFKNGIKGYYTPFLFVSSTTACSYFNSLNYTNLTVTDIADDLGNRDIMVKSLKNEDEQFIIVEYEFK